MRGLVGVEGGGRKEGDEGGVGGLELVSDAEGCAVACVSEGGVDGGVGEEGAHGRVEAARHGEVERREERGAVRGVDVEKGVREGAEEQGEDGGVGICVQHGVVEKRHVAPGARVDGERNAVRGGEEQERRRDTAHRHGAVEGRRALRVDGVHVALTAL
jgi:hypothetical protein